MEVIKFYSKTGDVNAEYYGDDFISSSGVFCAIDDQVLIHNTPMFLSLNLC